MTAGKRAKSELVKVTSKKTLKPKTAKMTSNAFRRLKVVAKLICLAVKFYLLAWFYIPRSFLFYAKAPKTLDEFEYDAKNSPGFLIFTALFAINLSCFLIYALYIIPVEMLAKHF